MSISDDKRGKWRRVINAIRRQFPVPRPVSIRVCKLVNHDATTVTRKDRTRIYISSRLDFSHACDALVHEFAHVLDAHERFDDFDSQHSETWGVLVSKVERFVTHFLEDAK